MAKSWKTMVEYGNLWKIMEIPEPPGVSDGDLTADAADFRAEKRATI